MVHLYSIEQEHQIILAESPETGITKYFIRKLHSSHPELFVRAGRKILVNHDKLMEFLNNPQPPPEQDVSKIRRIE